MSVWFVLPIIFLCALFLTAKLRSYALSHSLIDVPNDRSSHLIPTPRGGGVAIVVSFLLFLPFLSFENTLPWGHTVGFLGAGAGIAILGFLDDHGHIAARWRLLGHFSAACWAMYWVAGLPVLSIFGLHVDLGIFGYVVAALYLVWMLNLYNFMDGIDGIASIEAVTVCLGAALLYWIGGFYGLIWAPLLLAFAVFGFLYWNFPPARIFMGDAGSGFLGIILGIFSLEAASVQSDFFWAWLILLGVFIVDATVTLIRRLFRGEKVYEAHRSHAYQFASRQLGKHRPVSLAIGAINILWLLPLAFCVIAGYLDGIVALLIAYVPLIILAIKYKAGMSESR
ncbi:Undecaprenyl-phosphate alpha-N-acetylglucosaminyl 1-phosphate transferase [Pseudomonas chlororaphis subsp. aurantiaca]|uniref:Glycosyltransferase family 4 protein n=1 Tax=Pseudomonas chlororaphis subsp. aurantiaca TaxID=86192 RepID=A0AAJ0ZKD0_9PSED|nr:glycosyltransferase family 4 protein [Pseudomonas chlororaphis]AZD23621.1 Undecaprenyl-phosphate alpha-N-acetylglucosaminyl 1-phosphate transferase [Pseudomonas chlororaphis subsp. aurantiaca]MBU4633868.1 glycosyltransferase family 4 protein [Pseudomonas chlororaphis subsp. aurantiaca]